MSHLGLGALRRLLCEEGGPQELEAAAEHLVSCRSCRALAARLRAENPGLRSEGPLQRVFDLIDRERHWAEDYLAAVAEWAELQRLPGRRSQRDRVRMTQGCHTITFFNLVLGELKETSSWEESELLAGLASLCIAAMSQRQRITRTTGHDLKAKVWTAVANVRRRAAEWERAHQALTHAERHRTQGTGDPLLEAELLSITASTLADEGHVARALEALERCKAIYRNGSEWHHLARVLVKLANILAGTQPAKGLVALDEALPLIPTEDSYLTLLSGLLRVECLIEVQRPRDALPAFRRCSRLLSLSQGARVQIRGRFTGARLLDALGYQMPAERLFDDVVDRDIENELYKDAFLDLLYVYERHVKAGEIGKAARVCRKALTDPALAAVAHDQMRTVWEQLLAATGRHAVGREVLSDLRQYLNVHWKHPAAKAPAVGLR